MQLHKFTQFIGLLLLFMASIAGAFSFNSASEDTIHSQEAYQLKLAEQFLNNKNPKQAERLLKKIDTTALSPALQVQKSLLDAHLAITLGNSKNALLTLGSISHPANLPNSQKVAYFELVNLAYSELGDFYHAALATMQLTYLNSNTLVQHDYIGQTWGEIQQLALEQLDTFSGQAKTAVVQGWLALGKIKKLYREQPSQMHQAIATWQQRYPQHPANAVLPEEGYGGEQASAPISSKSEVISPIKTTSAQQIALLLPLSGPLADSGNAAKNGFMAAYYAAKKNESSHPVIKVYDTWQKPIFSLYQQAANEGASLVVGPLGKENVTTLARSHDLSVPTLALNYTTLTSNYLYQFALSPKNEAESVAQKMLQQNKHQAFIMAPTDEWAKSITDAFIEEYQKNGGVIVGTGTYGANRELASFVKNNLFISDSEARKKALEQQLQQKIAFEPRYRQDIDGVFLVATPASARSIRPLFKFYYASIIPLYATSMVYSGQPDALRDQDLDGITFCVMPWEISNNDTISQAKLTMQQLQQKPTSTSIRLFAFGYDAYQLASHLPELSRNPGRQIKGVTGTLYLSDQQRFYRQLLWAKFQNGLPEQQIR